MAIPYSEFAEILKDSYSAYYSIHDDPDELGTELPIAFRADYVARDERYPLTPAIAYKNGLTLPEDFRCDCSMGEKADLEEQLKRLASINGLIEIE